MIEEMRNHEAEPTAREREWMSVDPIAAAVRAAVFIVVSVAIGGYVSEWADSGAPAPALAKVEK